MNFQMEIAENKINTSDKFYIKKASLTIKGKNQDSKFHEFIDEDNLNIENNKNDNQVIGAIIDEMGFSKYNFLIFITAGIILFFSGVQEIMLSFQLSMILENQFLNEFHLACINTIEVAGYTFSSLLVNVIVNFISSKKSVILFCCLLLVFTGSTLLSLNYFFTLFVRFFIGFFIGMLDILIYLNLIESMPTKIRGFISGVVLIFFPLGQLIMGVFSYKNVMEGNAENNFKYLLLIPFIFLVCMLIFIIFIHESPRHLIADKNINEGIKAIMKISQFNNKSLEIIQKENKETSEINKAANEINLDKESIIIIKENVKKEKQFNKISLEKENSAVNKNDIDISLKNKPDSTIENIFKNDNINDESLINIELENKNKNLLTINKPFEESKKNNIGNKYIQRFSLNKDILNSKKENNNGYVNKLSNFFSSEGKTVTEESINSKKKSRFTQKLKKIFKPKYKKITITLWICSFCTGFIFNGIFFMLPTTAPKLDPLHMKEVIISVAVELPSIFLAAVLIETKRIGRLWAIKTSYFFCFLVCIVCLFVKKEHDLFIDCAMKFFITIPTNILIVYTSEIYSSRVRTIGRSMSDFWKRIGNIMAPFVVSYLEMNFGVIYTFYAFILVAFVQMIASLALVIETVGKRLDEIIIK